MDDPPIKPHLEYLCIYNPDLDTQGDQLQNQILYYYGSSSSNCSIDQQLRYIGLAQGVVELSKEFSDEPLSTIETTNSRLVVKEVESPNWWIVGNFNFGNGDDSKDGKNIENSQMLISEIYSGYRRWRLHYGPLDVDRIDEIRTQLKPWWDAWCHNWNPTPTCITDLYQVDHLKYARGRVSTTTSEAATALLERDNHPGLIQMVVLRRNDDNYGNGDVTSDNGQTTVHNTSLNSTEASPTSPSSSSSPSQYYQSNFQPYSQYQLDNNGLVWTNNHSNRPSIDDSSVCDLLNWIQECLDCNNNNSFFEPSGYVAHLNSSNFHSDITKTATNEINSSIFPTASIVKGMASIIPSVSSAASTMGTATMTSMNQLIDTMNFMNFKAKPRDEVPQVIDEQQTNEESTSTSANITDGLEPPDVLVTSSAPGIYNPTTETLPSNLDTNIPPDTSSTSVSNTSPSTIPPIPTNSTPTSNTSSPKTNPISSYLNYMRKKPKRPTPPTGLSDELSDSRFLIGLMGNLEEEAESFSTSDVTSKEVMLKLNLNNSEDEPLSYESCKILIYRRRPFVYVLIYRKTQTDDSLETPSLYVSLHRKLASLSEPFFTDLDLSKNYNSTLKEVSKFYYLIMDNSKFTMQSSLPDIPKFPSQTELELLDPTIVEKFIQFRLDLIQIHQALCYLNFEARDSESERFIRTNRGWWLYWTSLSDGRVVMFARKALKRVNSGESNGLLAALGKDAKLWLEEYKYHGKV